MIIKNNFSFRYKSFASIDINSLIIVTLLLVYSDEQIDLKEERGRKRPLSVRVPKRVS